MHWGGYTEGGGHCLFYIDYLFNTQGLDELSEMLCTCVSRCKSVR